MVSNRVSLSCNLSVVIVVAFLSGYGNFKLELSAFVFFLLLLLLFFGRGGGGGGVWWGRCGGDGGC